MRFAFLAVLAFAAAIVQHRWLATMPLAPDLPLALLAWAVVDGTDEGVLVRAWMIGLIRDVIDPASLAPGAFAFHTFCYLGAAIIFLPVRHLLFRTRGGGWAGWAIVASLCLSWFDRWWWGGGDGGLVVALAIALLTALSTLPIGWSLGWLPARLHPVGKGGA